MVNTVIRSGAGLLFLSIASTACSNPSAAPQDTVEVFVGFVQQVDESALAAVDAEVIQTFGEPIVALVRMEDSKIADLERHKSVAFVQRLDSESVVALVEFEDRPTADSPLSESDVATLNDVGAEIRYQYSFTAVVAVSVLRNAFPDLAAAPGVKSAVIAECCPFQTT